MDNWILINSVMTLIILASALTIRTVLARYIRSPERQWSTQKRLRGLHYLKSATIIGFFLLNILIWGEQLQGFAVSVFAIAFAMVFTIKETLTSLNGAFIRWQGHSYEVGDRITIKDYRGDVIDISLLTTTIMEIGKVSLNPLTSGVNHLATGRKIVFPNSLLLAETVINESYLGAFQIIDFSFTLSRKDQWKTAEKILHKIVHEECSVFIEQARNKVKQLEKIRSVDLPQIEPKILVSLAEKDAVRMTVRCPAPAHQKDKIEQNITKKFLEEFFHQEELKEDMIALPKVQADLN